MDQACAVNEVVNTLKPEKQIANGLRLFYLLMLLRVYVVYAYCVDQTELMRSPDF